MFKLIGIIFVVLLFPICSFAQQYNGVNVTRIKGSKHRAKAELTAYHQFSLGIAAPRSMNLDGDTYWYNINPSQTQHKIVVPGVQLEYAYNWQRYAFFVNVHYDRYALEEPTIQSSENVHLILNQWTPSFGLRYKWLYQQRLQLYSGASIGTTLKRFIATDDQFPLFGARDVGIAAFQIAALGINYNFNNFGIFGELGYGKKGILCAGLFYRI